ncbi:MAG: CpsD/CapB family tyrosine-protein kinase [Clostridia bacterium]|nr:CpsD/CapB family tyrosine-protein kinase [Clostridia bacterium]
MKRELIAQRTPKSPIAEVFRTLRTNIQFMNSKKSLKTLLVTSTMPGEGKSWVAANLAITFAQAGKKVLIIDADMRKGRQHVMFNIENRMGLSNFLSGIDEMGRNENLDILKYVRATEIQNLFLIPAGNVPPNPSELLASETTINMIEKLKEVFDFIIFDGTPSLLVTDALIVARLVDSTVIVTEHNGTKKENLEKVKKDIENVGGNIVGIILNKISINAKKYMETYYYSSTTNMPATVKKSTGGREKKETTSNNPKADYIFEKNNNISSDRTQEIIEELNRYLKK